MRVSQASLLAILLVWGSAPISCAPTTHAGITPVREIQPSDPRGQTPDHPVKLGGILTLTPGKDSDATTLAKSGDSAPDDGMFRYWFDMYLEFLSGLWSFLVSLANYIADLTRYLALYVLPFALFLVACAGTMFAVVFAVMAMTVALGEGARVLVQPRTRGYTERSRLL